MNDITKDFLIKNGFREEYKNFFTYINKEYTIDAMYYEAPYNNRHWKIIIISSTGFILGDILVQTQDEFSMIMELYDVDLNIMIDSDIYPF